MFAKMCCVQANLCKFCLFHAYIYVDTIIKGGGPAGTH
jgi:hypothetical protein